ncbi:LysR family transcriptional regulator [uncultured Amnibacterium sp.]|uniref:LysR family transcriptional regulator n=1 Tax=uncultured Amnibacterium sp. TaxID=1631851 RepID=UPI0035CA5535
MKWTLDQLRSFSTVADLGTMTAAAEALGFTPGAVSQQMSALQAGLPRPIFVRDGRRVSLTDAGLTLLVHARRLLDEERRAEAAILAPESEQDAVVSVGVFGSAAVSALRPAIERLRTVAPRLVLRAVEVDVEVMSEAAAGGEVDIALGVDYDDAPQPPSRGVVTRVLHREPFLMLLPPNAAPLVGVGAVPHTVQPDPALLEYVNKTAWVLPPVDTDYGRAARIACARGGIEPSIQHLVTDTAVSIALAEAGVGITLATPLMLALRPTRSAVAPLPAASFRSIVAVARAVALERPSVVAVRDALAAAFTR